MVLKAESGSDKGKSRLIKMVIKFTDHFKDTAFNSKQFFASSIWHSFNIFWLGTVTMFDAQSALKCLKLLLHV